MGGPEDHILKEQEQLDLTRRDAEGGLRRARQACAGQLQGGVLTVVVMVVGGEEGGEEGTTGCMADRMSMQWALGRESYGGSFALLDETLTRSTTPPQTQTSSLSCQGLPV